MTTYTRILDACGERLAAWLRALAEAKRARLLDEPELFAAYAALGDEHRGAVARHLSVMVDQLAGIIADGVRAGEFAHPDPTVRERLDAIIALLIAGLQSEVRPVGAVGGD